MEAQPLLLNRTKDANGHSLTIYDFENVGDELGAHTHDASTLHMTVVARGSVQAFGDGWEMIAPAGTVLAWKENQTHGMRALEPLTRIINIPAR